MGGEDLAGSRHRLSSWLAILTAAMAMIALATAVTTPPRSGPYCRSGCVVAYPYTDAAAFVPRDYLWMYPAVLLTVLVVVLVGVLHDWVPWRRRALSRIGRSFTTIGATVLIVAYASQLSVIQPALVRGETEGLSPWTQYHPYGLFIALENVGYATLNLGFLFIGAALLAGRPGCSAGPAGCSWSAAQPRWPPWWRTRPDTDLGWTIGSR